MYCKSSLVAYCFVRGYVLSSGSTWEILAFVPDDTSRSYKQFGRKRPKFYDACGQTCYEVLLHHGQTQALLCMQSSPLPVPRAQQGLCRWQCVQVGWDGPAVGTVAASALGLPPETWTRSLPYPMQQSFTILERLHCIRETQFPSELYL